MCRIDTLGGSLEFAEPVLEQVVGPVEIRPQATNGSRPAPTVERLLAGRAEELTVDADQEARSDPRIPLVDRQLRPDRVGEDVHEAGHHLELLRLQSLRLLDDARERREAGAAQPWALGELQLAQRREDRLARS